MFGQKLRRVLGLGLVAGAGLALSSSCAENESTLYIAHAIMADEECVATADDDIALTNGALDVALAQSYAGFVVVHNEVVEQGDPDRPKSETSRVILYDSEVTVEDPNSGFSTSYSWPLSGFVPEGPDGRGVALILMMDQASVQAISATLAPGEVRPVLVTMKVFGRTTGGLELETPEWTFLINVGGCNLVDCSAEYAEEDDAGNLVPCAAEPEALAVCQVGQDVGVPCNQNPALLACCQQP